MMLSDDPEAEEEDDLFVLTSDSVDPADVLVPALILQVQMTYLCKEDMQRPLSALRRRPQCDRLRLR